MFYRLYIFPYQLVISYDTSCCFRWGYKCWCEPVSGLGQCAELVWQLRGEADKRQVEGARIGMQHNFGIGGAAVVTMYKKYEVAAKL